MIACAGLLVVMRVGANPNDVVENVSLGGGRVPVPESGTEGMLWPIS